MAFADPQTITVDTVAIPLARSFGKGSAGTFISADGANTLEFNPSNGKTKVRTARLRNTKVTSDPLVTTTNVRVNDLISLSVIRPLDGYTDAEVVKQVVGFLAYFTANANANLIKFVAGEN